jgi:hypothetical protein
VAQIKKRLSMAAVEYNLMSKKTKKKYNFKNATVHIDHLGPLEKKGNKNKFI